MKRGVVYPKHCFRPEDLLNFIEMHGFSDDWFSMGLTDDDLAALEIWIMLDPEKSRIIDGTGGLRKVGYSTDAGPVWVSYVYFAEYGIVLLVAAYGEDEPDDLPEEHKREIRDLIEREERVFSRGPVR